MEISFYKNGELIQGVTGTTLGSGNFSKHDNITCQQKVFDIHYLASDPQNSTTLEILNSPPILDSIGDQTVYELIPKNNVERVLA